MILALALAAQAGTVDFEPIELDAYLSSMPEGGDGLAGVAVFDYDRDGDLDIFLGNGPNRSTYLLQNDGAGNFTDVTLQARARVDTGARGILTADFDSDGYPDVLITGDSGVYGTHARDTPTRMLMNNGDGTFRDWSAISGVRGSQTNMGAVTADVDNDGDLDIYIAAPGALRMDVQHVDTLYLNNGDGTFVEGARKAGVEGGIGACAPQFTHLDDDGLIDLLVGNCNDVLYETTPFSVYMNQGGGRFVNIYPESKIWALGYWMGVALADFDGDNDMDFFSTNSGMEVTPHVLYRNNGDRTWTDIAPELGVAALEFGWGTVSPDFDNDGWSDLYWVGASRNPAQTWTPGYVFFNAGDGTFLEPEIPLDLSNLFSGGLAQGDLNGDGYVDMVLTNTEKPGRQAPGIPYILMNQGGTGNHQITVKLTGITDNLWGIGAQIRADVGDRTLLREVEGGSSICSTNSPWPTLGIGALTEARICVRWPNGVGEDFGVVAADQVVELVQGAGIGAVPCNDADPWGVAQGSTGDTGGEAPNTSEEPADEDPECGCAHSRGAAGGLAVVLALVARRRCSA